MHIIVFSLWDATNGRAKFLEQRELFKISTCQYQTTAENKLILNIYCILAENWLASEGICSMK